MASLLVTFTYESYKKVTTVSSWDDLTNAAADADCTEIDLQNDITATPDEHLTVDHPVTIDGNGHKLTFSGLNDSKLTDDADDGLVIAAADTVVKDLTVDAGLGESKDDWVGTYAIQVYKASDVTLENVTAKGGNGGILVNGSDVTLKGKIDVSGNGTGGINLSKEADVKNEPELDAADATLVNTSEKTFAKVEKEANPTLAFWNPTIWVDKVSEGSGSNAVNAPDLFMTEFPNEITKDGTYYLYFLKIEDSGNPYFTAEGAPQTVQVELAVDEDAYGKITTFDATGRTPVKVSLHKGAADYSNVKIVTKDIKKDGKPILEDNYGIQLIALDTQGGAWWDIAKAGWGVNSGFALQDATTPVYLVASEPGTYTATIQLVNVANNNAVLAETTAKVTAVNTAAPVQLAPKEPEVTGSDSTITDALANATPGEDLNVLAQQQAVERFEDGQASEDDRATIDSVAGLAGLRGENDKIGENNPVVVVAQPYLDINAKAYEPTAGTLELEITPKCKLVATSKTIADSLNSGNPTALITGETEAGQNGVEISDTPIDVPSGSAVTLTIPLPSTFQVPAGGLQVKHVKTNGDVVYYYPATVADNKATFTVTHGFSDFTLQAADTRTLTVGYDSGVLDATYSITDVGSALPTASKPGYDFNGWKFGSDTEAYTTLTDALWDAATKDTAAGATVSVAAAAQFTKQSSGNPGGTPVVPEQPEEPTATYKSDTTYDLTVNGAYTFLITSLNGKKPSFAVGTPGVFRTELVHTVGNDYYYKITAIGKAGSQAGIYLNGGSRLLVATVGKPASDVWCDTPSPFTLAAGSAYQFKFVAGEKPSLACGNDKVFQLRFVRQSGDEYYYRIAAVGKKGDCAGFYLNGEKSPSIRVTVW